MRIRVQATDAGPAILAVSRALRLSPDQARRLLAVERVLPAQLEPAAAEALAGALTRAGVDAEAVEAPDTHLRCVGHPTLTADNFCETCHTACCALCADEEGRAQCRRCARDAVHKKSRLRLRLVPLTLLLIIVAGYAYGQLRTRERKVRWDRPLRVALVPVATRELDVGVEAAWREGAAAIQAWFKQEGARWKLPLPAPVEVVVQPSVVVAALPDPQRLQSAEGVLEQSWVAFSLRRELRALGPQGNAFDVTLVVALGASPEGAAVMVEGAAQAGGDVGLVRGADRDATLGLELVAVAHEILHTVGALDAYDGQGHAVAPQGLAEPLNPPYPQHFAEVMAGEIPDSAQAGHLPKDLDEVRIGEATARAVRWFAAAEAP